MTESFAGAVVAHFESRMSSGLDALIRRHGGEPWSAPAVSEERADLGARDLAILHRLASGEFGLVVMLTGAGAQRLFDESDAGGFGERVRAQLAKSVIVARGPKSAFVLRRHGLTASRLVPEPNTTRELIETLGRLDVSGQCVLILNAGDHAPEPARSLADRGASVAELQLYRWSISTDDADRLTETIDALAKRRIDAALFTSQIQVQHLFEVAGRRARSTSLSLALMNDVVVGAVGPTCADALRARGVEPDIVPNHPKMGHLVRAAAVRVHGRSPLALHDEEVHG